MMVSFPHKWGRGYSQGGYGYLGLLHFLELFKILVDFFHLVASILRIGSIHKLCRQASGTGREGVSQMPMLLHNLML